MSLGQILAQKREDSAGTPWEFTQGDVAATLGVSRGQVSILEREEDKLRRRDPDELYNIIRAYRFTDEEAAFLMARFYRHYIDSLVSKMPSGVKLVNPLRPVMAGRTVPIRRLGVVGAGLVAEVEGVSHYDYIDTDVRFLGNAKPENCYWLDVEGDSMVCDDVRDSIAPGSQVLVDGSVKEPTDGQIIVCELEVDGKRYNVLKVFRRGKDYAVLRSYNPSARPIVMEGEICAVMRGVMIGHYNPTKTLERRRG
jgi:SOS-response transcriptional repressor LexA